MRFARTGWWVLAVAPLAFACDEAASAGEEGGNCRLGEEACDEGLVCSQGTCSKPTGEPDPLELGDVQADFQFAKRILTPDGEDATAFLFTLTLLDGSPLQGDILLRVNPEGAGEVTPHRITLDEEGGGAGSLVSCDIRTSNCPSQVRVEIALAGRPHDAVAHSRWVRHAGIDPGTTVGQGDGAGGSGGGTGAGSGAPSIEAPVGAGIDCPQSGAIVRLDTTDGMKVAGQTKNVGFQVDRLGAIFGTMTVEDAVDRAVGELDTLILYGIFRNFAEDAPSLGCEPEDDRTAILTLPEEGGISIQFLFESADEGLRLECGGQQPLGGGTGEVHVSIQCDERDITDVSVYMNIDCPQPYNDTDSKLHTWGFKMEACVGI